MKFQIDQAVELLSQTPATVKSLLGNLPDEWTKSFDDKENWSPFDVVGHYIHCEETDWIPRAEIILKQDDKRSFEPFDRYAQFEQSRGKTLGELLNTFAERRRQSLETLRSWNLAEEDLRLQGDHPEFGAVTLEQLLATWVVHDLTHLRQLATALAKNYADAVGPWKEYLSILK